MTVYGLGAGGALGIALETGAAPGTWVTPAVSVPILEETLTYNETRYYSEAIRNQTIANDVRQGYYHIQGTVRMEVDTRFLMYFLHSSRWGVVKTGTGPYVYTYTPSATATVPSSNRTASITIVRNGAVFAYSGCQVTRMQFTVVGGILQATMDVLGTTDTASQTFTPSFSGVPRILSAPCHQIFLVDGATTSGAITVGSAINNFDGWTLDINDNGAVQNRIFNSRAAAFISYGITDLTVSTSLDFLDKTEYAHYLASDRKSHQFLSTGNTAGVTSGHDIFQFDAFNLVYDPYQVQLGNWGNLVMAQTTMRGVASGGANPAADIVVTSDTNLTVS